LEGTSFETNLMFCILK